MKLPIRIMADIEPMPWGKYAGLPIGTVPANYLLTLYEKKKLDKLVNAYSLFMLNLLIKEEMSRKGSFFFQDSMEIEPLHEKKKETGNFLPNY